MWLVHRNLATQMFYFLGCARVDIREGLLVNLLYSVFREGLVMILRSFCAVSGCRKIKLGGICPLAPN